MIGADNLGHLLEAVDVSIDARKEVPDANRAAGLGDRPGMARADLPTAERCRPHRLRSQYGRVRQQQRLGRDLDRLLCHVLGSMRDVADKAEPITGADHFGAEFGETLMGDDTRLKVTDVIWCVMHELHMPDAPPMRLFQPFEFPLQKIETLDIGDDRRFARPVRRFEIRGIQRAAHIVTGDQLVHPGEAIEVVPIKLVPALAAH